MKSEQFDLFLILLKLKSYLVSLLDDPRNEGDSFEFTIEFLDRKYPNLKDEILELLTLFQIHNDAEIAFNEKIHLKFKEMVRDHEPVADLNSIFEQFQIFSPELLLKEKQIDEMKIERGRKLKEVIDTLIQLARMWSIKNEIDNDAEDYSVLDEENMMRPHEKEKMNKIDENVEVSFSTINQLTTVYMERMLDYYFNYGGNLSLEDFVSNLDEFKFELHQKYSELFKKHGLDPTKIK